MTGPGLSGVIVGAVVYLLFLLVFCYIPASQSRQRGYSFTVWLVTGALAFNPIYPLIVLAAIPNRAKQHLRNQFRRELDAKLAAAQRRSSARLPIAERSADVPFQSIGDQPTSAPPAGMPSLGDQPTRIPRERSIGDEETRL